MLTSCPVKQVQWSPAPLGDGGEGSGAAPGGFLLPLCTAPLPSALSWAAGHPQGFHYEAAFTPLVSGALFVGLGSPFVGFDLRNLKYHLNLYCCFVSH
mgnify:CR=1 FL=1